MSGDYASAIRHASDLLDKHAASILTGMALHLRAVCLAESGSYDEALRDFRAFVGRHPRGPLTNRARLYIDLLTKHRDLDGRPLQLFLDHLRLHESRRYGKAIEAARALLARFPTATLAPKTVNAIAYIYLVDLGRYDAAIREFNTILRDYPNSTLVDNALFGIGTAEERKRRFEAALKVYKFLMKKHKAWFGPKNNYWSRLWYERTKGRIQAINALVIQNDYLGVLTQWTPYDMKYRRVEQFLKMQPYATSNGTGLSDRDAYSRANLLLRQARRFPYLKETAAYDFWQTPPETERRPGGDCEDQALWLFDRMQTQGIRNCRVFVGRRNSTDGYPHAWVLLYTESNGYILDPTQFRELYECRAFHRWEYVPHFSLMIDRRWRHGRGLR